MKYFISRKFDATFEQAVERVKELLEIEGIVIMSEVNLHEKIKERLHIPFRKYKVLGACDVVYAHRALQKESKMGSILPFNIIIQELRKNEVEVAAIDPVVSMKPLKEQTLSTMATEMKEKLERVFSSLHSGVESFGLV